MVRFTFSAAVLAFAMAALAAPKPSPLTPDPAQVTRVGNAKGEQFIGGGCLSSKDCADTACCATLPGNGGICSGLQADFNQGKLGCGFGDPDEDAPVASATPSSGGYKAAPVASVTPGSGGGVSNGAAKQGGGGQFIAGVCTSDADCDSGCCTPTGKNGGTCAARRPAEGPGGNGCGFGSVQSKAFW